MTKYAGIWMDQEKALIVSIFKDDYGVVDKDTDEPLVGIEKISSDVEAHVRLSGGSRSRKTPYGPQDISDDKKLDSRRKHQLQLYYQEIIRKISDARKVLIFGPGEAKLGLKKVLEKQKELAGKIAGVETADKMTENQIMAKVKKYFRSYT